MLNHLLIVAAGGAIGASLRHLSGVYVLRLMGAGFPWGTLFVNVLGSFVMGVFIAWLATRTAGASNDLRLFIATGVLGGFTTFSAFSLDFANMIERGAILPAFGYVTGSFAISIIAIFVGLWVARTALG